MYLIHAKGIFIVYLKIKFNWKSCILSGNPKPVFLSIHILLQKTTIWQPVLLSFLVFIPTQLPLKTVIRNSSCHILCISYSRIKLPNLPITAHDQYLTKILRILRFVSHCFYSDISFL